MSKQTIKITPQSVKDEMDEFNVVMTPDAIPDLNVLSGDVLELLDYIESDEMSKMENEFMDEYMLANKLEEKVVEDEIKLKEINQESAEYDNKFKLLLDTKRKIIKLRKSADKKSEKFENIIHGKYNNRLPMKIISLMIEPDRYSHLKILLDMFEHLRDVKMGKKDINQAAEEFGEENRERYVYPKFNGKDNFMKMMSDPKK